MKYFMLEGSFKKDRPRGDVFKEALKGHMAYWQEYYDAGSTLVSGAKIGVGGGIVVFKLEDDVDINDVIAKDPFVSAGVMEYNVVPFDVILVKDAVKDWADK